MDMHPEDVKAEVRKRGTSLAGLAKANSLSLQTLSRAIHTRSSAAAESIIADFIGRPAKDIWPSRYDATGRRLSILELRKVAA